MREVLNNLELELYGKYPDPDKLNAYCDDIFILGMENNADMKIVEKVCDYIDDIVSKS